MNRRFGLAVRAFLVPAKRRLSALFAVLLACAGLTYADQRVAYIQLGRQPDGSFLVSTEQRIEPGAIAFNGRPIDMALHPSGAFLAVLNQRSVLLVAPDGVIAGSSVLLHTGAGFRGAVWSPDGRRLFVSTAAGYVQELELQGRKLTPGPMI